jgi:hypothetical protein
MVSLPRVPPAPQQLMLLSFAASDAPVLYGRTRSHAMCIIPATTLLMHSFCMLHQVTCYASLAATDNIDYVWRRWSWRRWRPSYRRTITRYRRYG